MKTIMYIGSFSCVRWTYFTETKGFVKICEKSARHLEENKISQNSSEITK
jgi:hypothetical protein